MSGSEARVTRLNDWKRSELAVKTVKVVDCVWSCDLAL